MPDQPEDIFGSVDANAPQLPRRGITGVAQGRGVPPPDLPGATSAPPAGLRPLNLGATPQSVAPVILPPRPPELAGPAAPPRRLAPLPTPGAIPPARAAETARASAGAPPPEPFPTDAERTGVEKQPPVFGRRTAVIAAVVMVGAVGIGLAGWWAYATFSRRLQPGNAPAAVVASPTPEASPSALPTQEPTVTAPPPQPGPAVVEPIPGEDELDSDYDGLSDKEEKLYGTDPYATDSDSDGLTDRDEVKVFTTDPTAADTDGDGFADGQEVQNGYDPKGPGRIKAVPAQ